MNRRGPLRWRQVLAASCAAGSWTQAAAVSRPPGLETVAAQVVLEASSLEGATITATLEGTLVGPDAPDSQWVTVSTSALAGDVRSAWLGSDRVSFVLPYGWLRVRLSHAGGTPATTTAAVHLAGDQLL